MSIQAGTPQSPLIEELLSLRQETARLYTSEREKQLALEEVQRLSDLYQQQAMKLEETQLALNRARADGEDVRKIKQQLNTILEICRIPPDQMHDNTKLALIVGPLQNPYPASYHGGPEEVMITSMGKWCEDIGGNAANAKRANSNRLNDALKPVEGIFFEKNRVECGDGKRHYETVWNENMLRHPRMYQKPGEPYKNNGGDKQHCPNPDCGGELEKDLRVSYICKKCSIEYDRDLQPIQYQQVVKDPPVTDVSAPTNVVQFTPRMEMGTTPLPPSHCYNCGTTTPTDFKWNGFKWVCHSRRKTGCL